MRPHLLASAGIAAALLAGCGPDDSATPSATPSTTATSAPSQAPVPTPTLTPKPKPPSIAGLLAATILARAEAALHQARSFRAAGTIVYRGHTRTTDLRIGRTGVHGTITTDGAATKLILIGKTVYLQRSDEAWRALLPKKDAKTTIQLMHGRWMRTRATRQTLGELASLSDRTSVVRSIFEDAGPVFTKVGPRTVNGVRCIGLDNHAGVLWVDVTNARPVRIQPPKGFKGVMDFTEYNTAPEPKAPPAGLVVDVPET